MIVLAMWNHPSQHCQPLVPVQDITEQKSSPLQRLPMASLSSPHRIPAVLPPPDIQSVVRWADERLIAVPQWKIFAATLYADYIAWSKNAAVLHPVMWMAFAQWLEEAGYPKETTAGGRVRYYDIGLKEEGNGGPFGPGCRARSHDVSPPCGHPSLPRLKFPSSSPRPFKR
jgi:hypothetical protein